MTSFCRNIFTIAPSNTGSNIASKEDSHLTIVAAFLSGMVGSGLMFYSMRKRLPHQREVEFVPIDGRSLS